MLWSIEGNEKCRIVRAVPVFLAAAVLLTVFATGVFAAADAKQKTFRSPEEAVQALGEALRQDDLPALMDILGPGGKNLIYSGDDIADKEGRKTAARLFAEKHRISRIDDRKAVLELGNDLWPMPIPIVEAKGAWNFDTKAGEREILNRRIGKNELAAIQVCLAYVEAQQEYAASDHDHDGLKEYAQKFFSEQNKKDGLYWDSREGGPMSPMGVFVANAAGEGYRRSGTGKPSPYHGYYYRILKAQGKNASGGAFDYIVKGKMIGGFALIAYPAKYGASGTMTFMVNHQGVVYEKDLGPRTESRASAVKLFDPDRTWRQTRTR